METLSEKQLTEGSRKRLLILDVDNTLLHVPYYEPMEFLLAELKVSREEFYRDLPDGGIPFGGSFPAKVYPRPHLHEFLSAAQEMGYDLALCTTATSGYLDVVLPLCGVDCNIFCEIMHRDKMKGNLRHCKDLQQFSHLGYDLDQMVGIDDRLELYPQKQNILQIKPFEVRHKTNEHHKDTELLQMIEKLKYLGDTSLAKLRREARAISQREILTQDLALIAFNSSKYRECSFQPFIIKKFMPDIDDYPDTGPTTLDFDTFLVYKDYGLVGAIKKVEGVYLVNNLCPKAWTDVPEGISRYSPSDLLLDNMFWFRTDVYTMADNCASLGYSVPENDPLTLSAATITQTHAGLHFLAYYKWFEGEDPMTFK